MHQRQLTVVKENTQEETVTKLNTTRSGYETEASVDRVSFMNHQDN